MTRRLPRWFLPLPLLLVLAAAGPAAAQAPVKTLPLPGEVLVLEHRPAFVIPAGESAPAARGPTPWLWYAPTLPNLPSPAEVWLFQKLQAAGIAIAGIDVGESYGSPAGVALYDALYREMVVRRGFSPRPVLLGRSRGGLMTLAWAAANPDRVAAWAGIYPVANLASYPGLAKAAPAYGLTAETLAADLPRHNPVDRLAGLARARVPFFAIHGDSDKLVPLEANSALLRGNYAALGGPMTLVIPPHQGHSMWPGFFENEDLAAFLIAHARPAAPK